MIRRLLLVLMVCASFVAPAQYTLNGNASQDDCHCYTLTPDALGQSGSIWNNNKIDLNQSFDFNFDVFLGCADAGGADGISFVLQPISTSVGAQGGGLGYSGVSPAVGITIDTWQNGSPSVPGADGDPVFDHIAIQLNGDLNHKDSVAPAPINNIAGPVTVLPNSDNIEDCNWHILRIQWDVSTKTIAAYVDGNLRVAATMDFVPLVFNNDPKVFWGFTGSTGGSKNLQQVCTSLRPKFRILPDQKRCIGEWIQFFDSTISFAPIKKFSWDFGDGTPQDSVNINPVHRFASAGNYTVVQTVLGADGCTEVNSQQLVIGSKPVAEFTLKNLCINTPVELADVSTATFGTINNWYWNLGEAGSSNSQTPVGSYSTSGFKNISLAVRSLEGCVSDTVSHLVAVFSKPTADFSFNGNPCTDAQVRFDAVSVVSSGTILKWIWTIDSVTDSTSASRYSYRFNSAGLHPVAFFSVSSNGCASDTIKKDIEILAGPVAAFTNSAPCLDAPVFFKDSSSGNVANDIVSWWWDLGNGNRGVVKDPEATYNTAGNKQVRLVVKTVNGCMSDTLTKLISVESKPGAKFDFAAVRCENSAIQFTDLSLIDSGTIRAWLWNFGDHTESIQQPAVMLNAGNHLVKLVVQNGNGCNSDTAFATIKVDPQPTLDFATPSACINQPVSFAGIASAADVITEWKWLFDDGSIVLSRDVTNTYTNAGTFAVSLAALSDRGCADTITKDIVVYSTQAFAGNDTIAAVNQPIRLSANGGVSYEWSPSTGLSNSGIPDPIALNATDRQYILKAFTPAGCASYDTINIKVYEGPQIYIPKAFTPNNDGLNDVLKALAVGMSEFKYFNVYNRYGQLVFTTNLPSQGWNGSFKGQAQDPGMYTWVAAAIGLQGNAVTRKGTVMLIR